MYRLMVILCVFFSLSSYAFEIKALKDNATVDVTISSRSLNRIFVTTDRIVETYGIEGSFKIEKDEEQGSIFIIPTGYYKNHPFNLFIKTEHGHNYTLHLTPAGIESKTIGLKPLSPAKIQAMRWEISSPYENVLIDLIRDMIINKSPQGYAAIPLGNNQPMQLRPLLAFQLTTIYRGDRLEGQVWLVRNIGRNDIYLNPKNFHDERILAASFDKKMLKKNEVAKLYWVKNYAS